jgi:hypothetical protein
MDNERVKNKNDLVDIIESTEPIYRKIDGGFCQMPFYIQVSPLISSGAKSLYLVLLHYFQQSDSCFPGQERLALDLGCSSRSVRDYIDELTKVRLISYRRVGLGRTNIYTLLPIERFLEKSKNAYQKLLEKLQNGVGKSSLGTRSNQTRPEKSSGQERSQTSGKVEEVEIYKTSNSNINQSDLKADHSTAVGKDFRISRGQGLAKVGELLAVKLASRQSSQGMPTSEMAKFGPTRALGVAGTAKTENRSAVVSTSVSGHSRQDRQPLTLPSDDQARLRFLIKEMSDQLGDSRHVRSNVGQALNIWQQAGLKPDAFSTFVDAAYFALGLTRERATEIRGSKAAYFFATWRDKLGIGTTLPAG